MQYFDHIVKKEFEQLSGAYILRYFYEKGWVCDDAVWKTTFILFQKIKKQILVADNLLDWDTTADTNGTDSFNRCRLQRPQVG